MPGLGLGISQVAGRGCTNHLVTKYPGHLWASNFRSGHHSVNGVSKAEAFVFLVSNDANRMRETAAGLWLPTQASKLHVTDKGLGVWEQVQNKVNPSAAAAYWQKNFTPIAGDRLSPDGEMNGDFLDGAATTINFDKEINAGAAIAEKSFAASIFYYAESEFDVGIIIEGSGTTTESETFSFTTVPNEWTRFSAVKTFTAAADGNNYRVRFPLGIDGVDTDHDFWSWAVQLVQFSRVVSPVINGSNITAVADDIRFVDSSILPTTTGTAYFEFEITQEHHKNYEVIWSLQSDGGNRLGLMYVNGDLNFEVWSGGSSRTIDLAPFPGVGVYRAACAWATDDLAAVLSGETLKTNGSATIPSATPVGYIGSRALESHFNDIIREGAFFGERKYDAEMTAWVNG